jgi:adenine-specific DNA-methyltransferase
MPILDWKGKKEVINHQAPLFTLETQERFGNDDPNLIVQGDNLLALKALLPEYKNRVKCIYIDPPYNTGNEGWVYNDKVNAPNIQKWLGDTVLRDDLTRHDKWLCMMFPRLKLLHQLLAPDGVIFVSIDDNEQHHLRLILDEIFGETNFLRNIIWHKRYAASNDSKGIPDVHDFVMCYQKSSLFNRNLLPRTDKQNSLYKYDSNDGMGLWRPDNLSVKTYSKDYDYPLANPYTGKIYFPPNGRCWMSNERQLQKWINEGRIFFGKDNLGAPQLKRYLNEVQQGVVPVSYWSYDEVNHTDGAKKELKSIFLGDKSPFETPKPTRLIEKILQLGTDKNAIVLDSFAGSGTTAHAVLNLNAQDGGNRRFILVEMEDYAQSITAERVKRVINGYADKPGTGGGFSYCTLGHPVFEGEDFHPQLSHEQRQAYLWYAETNQPFVANGEFYLGKHHDTAIYAFLAKDSVLDYQSLNQIKEKASQYIIYAHRCLLPEDFMLLQNICFKQLCSDVRKY